MSLWNWLAEQGLRENLTRSRKLWRAMVTHVLQGILQHVNEKQTQERLFYLLHTLEIFVYFDHSKHFISSRTFRKLWRAMVSHVLQGLFHLLHTQQIFICFNHSKTFISSKTFRNKEFEKSLSKLFEELLRFL